MYTELNYISKSSYQNLWLVYVLTALMIESKCSSSLKGEQVTNHSWSAVHINTLTGLMLMSTVYVNLH